MAISTQLTKATGTHLTSKESETANIPSVVVRGLRLLYQAYASVPFDQGSPSEPGFQRMTATVQELFLAEGVNTKGKILEGFRAIKNGIPAEGQPNAEPLKSSTHLCGWLLAFSGIPGDPVAWARSAGLDQKYNPWPSLTPEKMPEVEVEEASWEREEIGEKYGLINANPKSFPANMGEVQGQHYLVIEGPVDGGPAILGILLGCLRSSLDRMDSQRRPEKPDIAVIDLTGRNYLGLEDRGKVFYSGKLDRPGADTLTEEERWHLPIMEGVWQAHRALRDRLDSRKQGHKVDFPPHFLVLRRWNIILRDWNYLSSATKNSLLEAWRRIYDHPSDQSIDVAKAVRSILSLGDDVNVVVVMSIHRFGSVDDVGVSKNEVNSFLIVIPGFQGSANGNKDVLSALSDSRFQFISDSNRKDLHLAVEQGRRFSHETGHQYCLVNLSGSIDGAMVMTIPTYTHEKGQKKLVEDIKPPGILKRLDSFPSTNG